MKTAISSVPQPVATMSACLLPRTYTEPVTQSVGASGFAVSVTRTRGGVVAPNDTVAVTVVSVSVVVTTTW
jgi:hypothetical protein